MAANSSQNTDLSRTAYFQVGFSVCREVARSMPVQIPGFDRVLSCLLAGVNTIHAKQVAPNFTNLRRIQFTLPAISSTMAVIGILSDTTALVKRYVTRFPIPDAVLHFGKALWMCSVIYQVAKEYSIDLPQKIQSLPDQKGIRSQKIDQLVRAFKTDLQKSKQQNTIGELTAQFEREKADAAALLDQARLNSDQDNRTKYSNLEDNYTRLIREIQTYQASREPAPPEMPSTRFPAPFVTYESYPTSGTYGMQGAYALQSPLDTCGEEFKSLCEMRSDKELGVADLKEKVEKATYQRMIQGACIVFTSFLSSAVNYYAPHSSLAGAAARILRISSLVFCLYNVSHENLFAHPYTPSS